MEGQERREQLIHILENATSAVSGSELAKLLRVSRQVIVQDIALLRASNYDIVSTTKGYQIYQLESKHVKRQFYVQHTTEQIEDELCTIVDLGGKILDVMIAHPIYGEIRTDLIISNRRDVYEFVAKVKERKTTPLKELTGGIHHHLVQAESVEILDRIKEALQEKKYLIS